MRILFAEDEHELSDAVVAVLKHNHYSVDAVYDGQDAYDYLSAQEYDGAILDIMMPKMDGLEVVKKIRAEGNHIPVIFLTARSELDDKILGLDTGADDYLTKPFAMKELLARLRAITRRSGEVADNVLTFKDLSLDCSSYTLSCGDKNVALPNKEFQMMEMLMRVLLTVSNSVEEGAVTEGAHPEFFDRFYRADQSRNTENGRGSFGIGLSVVQAIVDAHKGKISADCHNNCVVITAKLPL